MFDIKSGRAAKALEQFTKQSGQDLLYSADAVAGVTTNAVRGSFAPKEALQRLLAGTPLKFAKAHSSEAIAIVRSSATPEDPSKDINSMPARKKSKSLLRLLSAFILSGSGANMSGQTKSTSSDAPKPGEDEIILSPFTVDTSKDKGYFAPDTLAGSRMKTNLADLGASISVVTKAEMEDFASTDVNDVFRYEINTEGSGTYTPGTQTQRGDGIADVNAGATLGGSSTSVLTNAGANRVRGLGAPSSSTNYYTTIGAVPPDSYNTQSFEISRGPNSMLFGIGSPAGIVNQSTSQAALNRNTDTIQMRTDDRGSFRGSFAFNRALLKDKLAVYGAVLYDDKEFERKPSYDITRRQYASLTYKPFSKTTLTASFENYNNRNRRPNTLTPVDDITQWNLAGRPTYDALTKKITFLTTGKVVGPFFSSANNPNAQQTRDYIESLPNYNPALRGTSATAFGGTDTTFTFYNGFSLYGVNAYSPVVDATHQNPAASPLYIPGIVEILQSRTFAQIGNGQLQNWFQPLDAQGYRAYFNIPGTGGTALAPLSNVPESNIWSNPASSDVYNRDYLSSTAWTNNRFVSNMGTYRYAGVTDRSIYDWKKINIGDMGYGSQTNQNYNVELQQEITPDLFASAGWFRQVFSQTSTYTVSQLTAAALKIDINKYLPDGTPNPYFGLPFVSDQDPDQYLNKQTDDHFRGLLAYTPDFTHKDGWLKWLGHHQILGLVSRDESMAVSYRKRLYYVGAGSDAAAARYLTNPNNNADGTPTGWAYGGTAVRAFYLANPGDPIGAVTRSSGGFETQSYTGNVRVYNYATNAFENDSVTEAFTTFDSPARTQKILNSLSTGITSYLWSDRIIATLGYRLDNFKVRTTTTGAITNPDGSVTPALTAVQKFTPDGYFNDGSIWNRFNPWSRSIGRTKTGGGVARPFRGWASIERQASSGNQFWQFIRDLGFTYNWSDNFDIPTSAQTDAFGNPLPKPNGVGRDVGIQFSALDNKLFARISWFQANNQAQRNTSDTALSRFDNALEQTLFRNWGRQIALINMFGVTQITAPPVLTPQQELDVQAATSKIIQLPYTYYQDHPGITTTQDAVAKGLEAQLNYNTGNWRNRVTFGKQETVISNVLKEFDAWYAVRAPIMLNAKASDYLLPQYQNLTTYTTTTGTKVDLTTFWQAYGFNSNVLLGDAFGSTNVGNYYNVNIAPQVAISKALNGQAAPNQRKYHTAYNTGYDFTRSGWLKNFGIGGAERWESKSVIGYYGKATGSILDNPTQLDRSDVTRPIYDKANFYTDVFIKYKRKIFGGRIGMTWQLNVENLFENGHLQTVGVNMDGSPYAYRIIDSRKFTLTSTFEF